MEAEHQGFCFMVLDQLCLDALSVTFVAFLSPVTFVKFEPTTCELFVSVVHFTLYLTGLSSIIANISSRG